MNTVIDLMKSHSSVRRFKEEDIKEEDLHGDPNSWTDGFLLEELSVLLHYLSEKPGKERGALSIRPSGGHPSILCLPTFCRRSQPS